MPTKNKKKFEGFSDFEREAMKNRANELLAESKAGKNRAVGEAAALAAIKAMAEPDRSLGQKIHDIVTQTAPSLLPKTWYGMPAYANQDGKVVCFFQGAEKFKARYCTFGFNDAARLDEGNMWSTSFAIQKLTKTEEARIIELVKKAIC